MQGKGQFTTKEEYITLHYTKISAIYILAKNSASPHFLVAKIGIQECNLVLP